MASFYHLFSGSRDPVSLSDASWRAARTTWLCPECERPRRDARRADVALQARPPRSPMNIVAVFALGLIRSDLLDVIGTDLAQRCLRLGSVALEDGTVLKEWHTFLGVEFALIHGKREARRKTCSTCGRVTLFPSRPRFLCEHERQTLPVAESSFGALVVNELVRERIVTQQWKELVIEHLPLRSCESPVEP